MEGGGGIIERMFLTSVAHQVFDVSVTGGLILVAMAVMVAIPFVAQFFIDDQRPPEE